MNTPSKIVLCVLEACMAVALAFSAASLSRPQGATIYSIAMPFAFFCLAVTVLSLISIAPVEAPFALAAMAASAVSFPVLFGFSLPSALLGAGFGIGAVLFWREARADRSERIKVVVGRHVEAGLGILFIVFFLGAAGFAYFSYLESPSEPAALIPDQVYDIAVQVSMKAVQPCAADDTVDSCVGKMVKAQMDESVPKLYASNCDPLPKSQQGACRQSILDAVEKQTPDAINQTKENLLSNFGVEANGTDSIRDFMKAGLKGKADDVLKPFEKFVPGLMAVLVYSTLNLLSFPAAFLIKLLSELGFRALLAAGVVEKKTVKVEAEIIE